MKLKRRFSKRRNLRKELKDLLRQMDAVRGIDDDAYQKYCHDYETLLKGRSYGAEARSRTIQAILGALGSIATVGLILFKEEVKVFPTKAWPFVPKWKI